VIDIIGEFVKKAGGTAPLQVMLQKESGAEIAQQSIWNWRKYGRVPSKYLSAFWQISQKYDMGYSLEQLMAARWSKAAETKTAISVALIQKLAVGESKS